MTEVTGATFNFNKTVTEEEPASTPDKPTDGAKVETKVAGEKKGKQNTKDFINLSMVTQTIKTAVNSAIQNVEGSQLSEQVSALQSIASTTVALGFMAYTNPYTAIASLACMGISHAFKMDKLNREITWNNYNLKEYKSARGYSAAYSRSRKS